MMSDEKKFIPHKAQKGNRPKIEDVITCCLDGYLQKEALDFAVFMRQNKMPFKLHTSTTRAQRASYNGYEICIIQVAGKDNDGFHPGEPQHWSISPKLYGIDRYDELAISEGLDNIHWEITRYCVFKDNPDRTDVNKSCDICKRITNRTIFGNEYKGLCHHYWPTFINPDETTVRTIKKLLKLEQNARDADN